MIAKFEDVTLAETVTAPVPPVVRESAPVVLIACWMSIAPPAVSKARAPAPGATTVIEEATVMLPALRASMVRSEPPASQVSIENLDSVMSETGSDCVGSAVTGEPPALMVMLSGSSRKWPPRPTLTWKRSGSRTAGAETSTKPPLAPPETSIVPVTETDLAPTRWASPPCPVAEVASMAPELPTTSAVSQTSPPRSTIEEACSSPELRTTDAAKALADLAVSRMRPEPTRMAPPLETAASTAPASTASVMSESPA